jgi:hypothetical protein
MAELDKQKQTKEMDNADNVEEEKEGEVVFAPFTGVTVLHCGGKLLRT